MDTNDGQTDRHVGHKQTNREEISKDAKIIMFLNEWLVDYMQGPHNKNKAKKISDPQKQYSSITFTCWKVN